MVVVNGFFRRHYLLYIMSWLSFEGPPINTVHLLPGEMFETRSHQTMWSPAWIKDGATQALVSVVSVDYTMWCRCNALQYNTMYQVALHRVIWSTDFHLNSYEWAMWFVNHSLVIFIEFTEYTERCRYNAVKFLPNSHNKHLIARPWDRGMGCLLWVWSRIYVLLLSSQGRW